MGSHGAGKAPIGFPIPVASVAPSGSSVSLGSLSASLLEAFKYTPVGDAAVTPGHDAGATHTDSGALTFGSMKFDALSVWSGTQWTVKNGAKYRCHARVKLTGVTPGDVFQLVLLGTVGNTTAVVALGPWCQAVTDDQGADQADVSLDEVVTILPVGAVVELHIKSNSAAAVTMKAPIAISADGAIPPGPYVAGSFLEVVQVPNA